MLKFPGSANGPWTRYVHDPLSRGIGTVRYPRLVPNFDDPGAPGLARRTLTNLTNERPTWLRLAHQTFDAAFFATYGWDVKMSDDPILAALLELNLRKSRVNSDAT